MLPLQGSKGSFQGSKGPCENVKNPTVQGSTDPKSVTGTRELQKIIHGEIQKITTNAVSEIDRTNHAWWIFGFSDPWTLDMDSEDFETACCTF